MLINTAKIYQKSLESANWKKKKKVKRQNLKSPNQKSSDTLGGPFEQKH